MNGNRLLLTRRETMTGLLGFGAACLLSPPRLAEAVDIDATFIFTNDIHACLMYRGLSPNCQQEGKTDANLRRHIAALNLIGERYWPVEIDGVATGLASAGERIATPLGIVVGGDMTDDGGGQVATPGEGTQLRQFSQRYQQGLGADRVHFPVYNGLGNHDLDQDGPSPHVDWYRRELRDYVELNHRETVFYKPPVPVTNYDVPSDDYSWDWGGLHLVQTHRFAGDTRKGAISGLDWLKKDLSTYAGGGKPVILFQHYGWDAFSTENWDPQKRTFDDAGTGAAHWWAETDRQALLSALEGYNVIGIFHGHEHETAMIYRRDGIDMFKPKAAFLGGFAIARVTGEAMDVVLAETAGAGGDVVFTNAFSKKL